MNHNERREFFSNQTSSYQMSCYTISHDEMIELLSDECYRLDYDCNSLSDEQYNEVFEVLLQYEIK